jgi:dienelactone hydrolase
MNDPTSHPTSTDDHAREELHFRSGDAVCAATLHRPANPSGGSLPCVVLAPGVSQTRRDGFPRFAERFAGAGLAALIFDFRHLGDSGGEPRQLIDVERQRADLAAAIAFARSLEGVDPDRVAVWGFSFGGGHAVDAATYDDRLAAAVTLCPFVDGLAFTLTGDVRNNMRLIGAAGRAAFARQPIRMPLVAEADAPTLFTQPEAAPGFAAVRAEGSRWRNEMLARPSQPAARIRPVRTAHRVRCPLLVGLGSDDTMVPARPIERTEKRAPRGELHRYPGGHFDGFLDHFDEVVDDHIVFLTRHLVSPPSQGVVGPSGG